MKIKCLLIPIVITSLSSCSYNADITEPKKVSLIDYIDENDLERYGFSAQDIENFDTKIKDSAVFSNEYNSYKTNGFTILSNDENPEHIFILKDKKFIASFDDKTRSLYSEKTNIPTQLDALITYIPSVPSLSYNNGELDYYDLNLDGIDIIYETLPTDDREFDYFSAEVLGTPNVNIIEAIIEDKECKALVGSFACCLSSEGDYSAYKFSYQDGWISIPDNKKLNAICNDNDFKTAKNKLKDQLFLEK